ncbi:MAG TPA: CHAT domain-containing protein, partial [Roseiflexaceae bacterium]
MDQAPQPATLRITHRPGAEGSHSVTVGLAIGNSAPQQFDATFNFALLDAERQQIQWYLETYLQFPQDPAPEQARQVEQMITTAGTRLFEAVFEHDRDARSLWARLEALLPDTRVEIASLSETGWPLPWELLRDPGTGDYFALRAREFVRAHPGAVRPIEIPKSVEPRIRILLVICRPRRRADVRFHSVARKLVAALGNRDNFQLDVLRPPTYDALAKRLRDAKAAGAPYHVLHFDGHGAFLDMEQLFANWKNQTDEEMTELLASITGFNPQSFSPEVVYPRAPRQGGRGYLAFENPDSRHNLRLVDGPELGALLAETGVPALVLNACRSARAAEPAEDETAPAGREADRHERVRAFGSFAQEVMDAGVAGVLAMRYNVYVVTAAQFVGNLYETLARGETFGAAASAGRKDLAAQPLRSIASDPIPLQDWMVPVVYEAAPIRLFPKPRGAAEGLKIAIKAADATPERGDQFQLPAAPDHGFFGRDETLLDLEHAFATHGAVVLHAFAGSGKTTTAAEFARWYSLTGGVDGPVLFSSFEQPKPLARVLDTIGQVFGGLLEQNKIHWLALTDAQRRDIALQVLQQIPVLWIWDNVEPVAGFPAGATATLSAAEQRELADFLRAATAQPSRAKFLLTSRRDEREWLRDVPIERIAVPPMPMQERMQFARELAHRHGRPRGIVDDWRALLRFTEGNPLTITVLVGQALRDELETKAQIQAFVDKLRAGTASFEDEAKEGRSKSLGASLSYGFAHAFGEGERKQLALLHLFQGFVNVDALRIMGAPDADWCLPEVRGLTREAGIALLDRAAEVGLLTAHGGGYYSIHPALPWYFRGLFEGYYPTTDDRQPTTDDQQGDQGTTDHAATRAFVEAIGALGSYYHRQYGDGNREVIGALEAEEANLLHARQLARANAWWIRSISAMQGLRTLYGHTGRRAEWQRLVDEIVPDFVDPVTGGPLPGREDEWRLVTEYRVRLADEARQWAEAERLQRVCVESDRRRATAALTEPPGTLDGAQRNAIRTLAVSLEQLGNIQREQGSPNCIASYEEAIPLCQQIGDRPEESILAFNLGHAYKQLPSIRDLAQAERWYRRSLELFDERDRLGQAKCLSQLGSVAYERFNEARAANQPEEDVLRHLNAAVQFYEQALKFDPPDHVEDLAVDHSMLGVIYRNAGDLDRALSHYREAIRYNEAATNLYGAARTRRNVAGALANAGRLADARLYAQAALRNFATYGDRAAAD